MKDAMEELMVVDAAGPDDRPLMPVAIVTDEEIARLIRGMEQTREPAAPPRAASHAGANRSPYGFD